MPAREGGRVQNETTDCGVKRASFTIMDGRSEKHRVKGRMDGQVVTAVAFMTGSSLHHAALVDKGHSFCKKREGSGGGRGLS